MIKAVVADVARRALLQKGYQHVPKRDHDYYFFFLDGKKTNFFFKISHGAREIRQDEIRISARQFKIKGDDLYRVLCCEHDAARTRELAVEFKTASGQ